MVENQKRGISEENVEGIISGIDVNEIEGKKEKDEQDPDKNRKNYGGLLKELDFLFNNFKISHRVYERIFEPDRIIEIDIPVLLERKSRGKEIIKIFTSYWVEHNDLLGPYLGEVNFLPRVKVEEIKGLAALSTLKNALLDIPFGGAAGGVAVSPSLLNSKETERLARSYTKSMLRFLDFNKDIMSGGHSIDEKSVSFMYDECKKLENKKLRVEKEEKEKKDNKKKGKKGETVKKKDDFKKNFLGKLFQDGGLRARNQAVASGILIMFEEALKKQEVANLPGVEKHEEIIKKSPREVSIALHGFNNVEQELAFMLFRAGYKIVAVSDSLGAVASASGIDPREAAIWQKHHRSAAGMPKVPRVKKEQLPEIKTGVLILGSETANSAGGAIDEQMARKIKSDIIIELEDVLTNEAIVSLKNSGKIVLPYVLTSCSNRLINYLEWLQNMDNKFLAQEEIDKKTEEEIKELFGRVNKTATEHNLNLKDAAFLLAIQKIADKLLEKV